jgi:hypothetical protein
MLPSVRRRRRRGLNGTANSTQHWAERRVPRATVIHTMTKQTAIRLHVEIGEDHTVKLPIEVPVGPAEVIVLIDQTDASPGNNKSLLGLFADEPEVVDEAMRHVQVLRGNWRMRPAT